MKSLLILFLGFSIKIIFASPNGAPDLQSICDSMMPGHVVDAQKSVSPFHLMASKTFAEGGELIQIEIEPDDGRSFKGFYLQARTKENTPRIVGEFSAVEGGQTSFNFRNCGLESHSTVTHADNQLKQKVTFNWRAPDDFEGVIVFQ